MTHPARTLATWVMSRRTLTADMAMERDAALREAWAANNLADRAVIKASQAFEALAAEQAKTASLAATLDDLTGVAW